MTTYTRYPGIAPSPTALASAPVLDDWELVDEPGDGQFLRGNVDGRELCTNTVLAMDAEAGWARAWCGHVRLGTPLDPDVVPRLGW